MIEVLAMQASRQPDAAMFQRDDQILTYREAYRMVLRLAEQLSRDLPAIRDMGLIGFSHSDPRWHLLISFALEALGVATLAFLQPAQADVRRALQRCDLILSEREEPLVQRAWFCVSKTWLTQALAGHADASFRPSPWRPDAVVAVLVTSGSSGALKSLELRRQTYDLREHNRIWQYGLTRSSRYLAMMPVTVSLINLVIRATLRCGGCVLLPSDPQMLAALAEATHTTLLPLGIRGLLNRLPANHPPNPGIRCFATGASLSPALRDGMIGRLDAQVQDSYGTNETGTVAWISSNGVADALPGVDVGVVDDQLKLVPRGVPGTIRIRTAEMAHGYLEPKHNVGAFVDGWFITSDRGISIGPRQFQLLGRIDSMLNIGGVKIVPEEVEELLVRCSIADDAGACGIADPGGIERLHILLVRPRFGDAELVRRLKEILDPSFGDIVVSVGSEIARSHAGKVRRDLLRAALLAHHRQNSRTQ